jgi:hypothetical protein
MIFYAEQQPELRGGENRNLGNIGWSYKLIERHCPREILE